MSVITRRTVALSLAAAVTAALAACDRGGLSAEQAANLTGGGVAVRGAEAMQRFGCGACHALPGIPGASG